MKLRPKAVSYTHLDVYKRQVKGRLLQGNLQASGQITMPKDQNPAVVFDVTVEGAKLSSVNDFGLKLPLEGKADIKAQFKGSLPNIAIAVDATSPQIAFAGFSLTDVSTGVEGLWNSLQIKSFNAKAGGGSLTASGNINYDKSLKLKLDVSGNSLDLKEKMCIRDRSFTFKTSMPTS